MVTKSTLNITPGQGLTIGFNIANLNTLYAYWSNLFADMRTLGLTWIRLNYSWRNIERTNGVYTWTVLDDAVQQINAAGFQLLFCLRGAPDWALTTSAMKATSEPWYLPDPTLMAGFATAVLTRYNGGANGRIDAIGYNEDFNIHHTPSTDILTLNSTISNAGGPYTTLTVTAASQTADAGALIYLGGFSNTTDVATISSAVAVGDTTVHINSFTPFFSYTSGTNVNISYIAISNSPYSLYNPGAAGVRPSLKSNPARDGKFAAAVMNAVTPAVRAISSTMPIGVPCIWSLQPVNGMTFPGSPSNMTAYLQQIYTDAGANIDAKTFLDGHFYDNAVAPTASTGQTTSIAQYMADIKNVAVANGDIGRPIWVTEFGWQVPQDVTESQQATNYQTVLSAVLPGNNPNKNKAFFFTLFYGTSGGTGSSLVYWNGAGYSYRQAFTIVQNYITQHPDTGGSGTVTTGAPYSTLVGGSPVFVKAGSLYVDNAIGRRSSGNVVAHIQDTSTHIEQDTQVSVFDQNGTLIFSGYVSQPREQKPGFKKSLDHTLTLVDQHRLADKRIIAASYVGKSAAFMVQDFINTKLSAEGVTVGQIYDGPLPSSTLYPSTTLYPNGADSDPPTAVFAYCSVAQALDALVKSTTSGGIPYYWQIDQNKALYFVPYTAIVNSTVLGVGGSDVNDGRASGMAPRITRANPAYRNGQYVTGGVSQTVPQIKPFPGDGHTTNWTLDFDVASIQAIAIDNLPKTYGIKGVDTGKDFYYAVGDPVIVQDSSGTLLTSDNQLKVFYIGQYPAVFYAQSPAQVSYLASIAGDSGIVEVSEADSTIASSSTGLATASNRLQRYGQQGIQAEMYTLVSGYAPGQMVTVDLPDHGLNSRQMLIEDMVIADQYDGLNIWYKITAIAGPYDVTWVSFFSNLLEQSLNVNNSINVGVSSSLVLLATFSAAVIPSATMTVSVYACPLPSTTLFPSSQLYPC